MIHYISFESFESLLPETVTLILDDLSNDILDGINYKKMNDYKERLSGYRLQFNYGLDSMPYEWEYFDSKSGNVYRLESEKEFYTTEI